MTGTPKTQDPLVARLSSPAPASVPTSKMASSQNKASSAKKRNNARPGRPSNPKKRKVSLESPSSVTQESEQQPDKTDDENDIMPYTVIIEHLSRSEPTSKKRKRTLAQTWTSSFDPALDVAYDVRTAKSFKSWNSLTAQPSIFREGESFKPKDVVYVLTDSPPRPIEEGSDPNDDKWVAEIVDIRSNDTKPNNPRIYLLINWLYRPEDLPKGRGSHHADGEVIPSNHMDFIELHSVVSKVDDFHQLHDDVFKEVSGGYSGLFWREHFNIKGQILRRARPICACRVPANPDFGPVQCTSAASQCGMLMHQKCAEDFVLERLYQRYVVGGSVNGIVGRPKKGKGQPSDAAPATPTAAQRIRDAGEYFECTLRRPTTSRAPESKLLARVKLVSKPPTEDGKALDELFDYPVRCLGCHNLLMQQTGHAILDPTVAAEQDDDVDYDEYGMDE